MLFTSYFLSINLFSIIIYSVAAPALLVECIMLILKYNIKALLHSPCLGPLYWASGCAFYVGTDPWASHVVTRILCTVKQNFAKLCTQSCGEITEHMVLTLVDQNTFCLLANADNFFFKTSLQYFTS